VRSGDLLAYAGALGYWAFDNAVLLVMFRALGHAPPVAVVAEAYLIGQLGGAVPTPLGLGGLDGGLIGAFVLFDVPATTATAAVVAYRALQLWVPAILGGAALLRLRRALDVGEVVTLRRSRGSTAAHTHDAPWWDPMRPSVRMPSRSANPGDRRSSCPVRSMAGRVSCH
jgi:hypothetical protein